MQGAGWGSIDGSADEELLVALYERAEAVARRFFPREPDAGNDLAHDLVVEVATSGKRLDDFTPRALVHALNRLAERRRKQRTRGNANLGVRKAGRGGRQIPLLCPCLGELACHGVDPRRTRTLILAAASMLAGQRGILRQAQRNLFVLAYEHRLALPDLVLLLDGPGPKAVVERLRRISRRIETELVRPLTLLLPEAARPQLLRWIGPRSTLGTVPRQEEIERSITHSTTRLCALVERALLALLGV